MRFHPLFCGAALAIILGSAAHANLLVNGSFEDSTGFVPDGNNTMGGLANGSTTITGWTVIGDSLAWIGSPNGFGLTASDGAFLLDLTDYPNGAPFGGVQQSFASVAGATYLLTFDLGSSFQTSGPSAIQASAGNQSALFTSTVVTGPPVWESQSLSFVATGVSTTVSLLGQVGFDYIGLDNVSVTFVSGPGPTAVPEPATWALMIGGFGLAGTAMRRRRAPAQG